MAKEPTQEGNPSQLAPATLAGPPSTDNGTLNVRWAMAAPAPVDTAYALRTRRRATVAFPPCADELLSLIKPNLSDYQLGRGDEIASSFIDYFRFSRHKTMGQINLGGQITEI